MFITQMSMPAACDDASNNLFVLLKILTCGLLYLVLVYRDWCRSRNLTVQSQQWFIKTLSGSKGQERFENSIKYVTENAYKHML